MLAKAYLIHGDDPLQIAKLIATIKEQAKQQGYNKIVFEINAQADWDQLFNQCQNFDLFASRALLEIKLHSGALDKTGSAKLADFLKQLHSDANFSIIINSPLLSPATLNSEWVKYLRKNGEIHAIRAAPVIYQFSNAMLAGDPVLTIKLFNSLKNSGVDPILVLWRVNREIKNLIRVKEQLQPSRSFQRSALQQHSTIQLQSLLRFTSKIDCTIKGVMPGNVWDMLLSVCLSLANPIQNPIPMEELTI